MITNKELLQYLNKLLVPDNFKDYCPNGLQIEGATQINKIVTGVSFNDKLINIAIAECAEAIIVHHGIFWNKEPYNITGIKKNRIEKLLKHNINLYAYHLPLDNHPEVGNNIQLAQRLKIDVLGQSDKQNLLWHGRLRYKVNITELVKSISSKLERQAIFCGTDNGNNIEKVAWCTGGADSFFELAIELGVDAFITGEISERVMSLASESGVFYISAGHYATERYGIMTLTALLQQYFQISANYFELFNPI